MAKKYDTTINGKKIVVTIEDDDEQYFPVSFEDYTGPDPDATPAPPLSTFWKKLWISRFPITSLTKKRMPKE